MVIKREGSLTVLEAARRRIINTFLNKKTVYLSFSGGKDSLCLLDITLKLAMERKISASQLVVSFIDEEAIFPCIDKTVRKWRQKVLIEGGRFDWFCLEVKHFCCFNLLEEEETFICWDSAKKDVWIRTPPDFAIMDHHCLKKRKHSYQKFLEVHNSDGICMIGVRTAESIQRTKYIANSFSSNAGLSKGNMVWPLYDWQDSDIWKYLYEQHIDIPDIYLYLYQSGSTLRDLRVSQFFSVDTAKSLVKMNEYYPDLMDRIIRREPNAYLAALYWDSEMFRRSVKNWKHPRDEKDYKAEVFKLLNNPKKHFVTKGAMKNALFVSRTLIKYDMMIEPQVYKKFYECLVGGDPKQRALRAIIVNINSIYFNKANRKKNGR